MVLGAGIPLCCACTCPAGAPSLPLHATPCWCLGGCSLPPRSRPRASVSRVWGVHVCLAGCGVCMGWGGGTPAATWALQLGGCRPLHLALPQLLGWVAVCALVSSASCQPSAGCSVTEWGPRLPTLLPGGLVLCGVGMHTSGVPLGCHRRTWALCFPVCSSRRRPGSPSWVLVRVHVFSALLGPLLQV
jgi:hypothetical protein